MNITDNFLDEEVFSQLQGTLLDQGICWHFVPCTDGTEGKDNQDQFFFGHTIYQKHTWTSGLSNNLSPLIQKIAPMAIHMIRANLMTKSESHIESQLHSDMNLNSPTADKISQWTTAIYYINDCNGYTKLEDGSVIESKANRLLTFPSDVKHLGATCTDMKRRVLINLNYFL